MTCGEWRAYTRGAGGFQPIARAMHAVLPEEGMPAKSAGTGRRRVPLIAKSLKAVLRSMHAAVPPARMLPSRPRAGWTGNVPGDPAPHGQQKDDCAVPVDGMPSAQHPPQAEA